MISVTKQIVVAPSQQRAFRAFTDGMDRWWPSAHHIGASPMARMVVEPFTGDDAEKLRQAFDALDAWQGMLEWSRGGCTASSESADEVEAEAGSTGAHDR